MRYQSFSIHKQGLAGKIHMPYNGLKMEKIVQFQDFFSPFEKTFKKLLILAFEVISVLIKVTKKVDTIKHPSL